ncbi:MAG: hypothetical protein IKE56_07610 [Lachnospiraceae bacterium]|nr:hypothetical protein [Lachnospiraceae bacterium]
MGKKGDLLRAQKAQRTTYTFTAAQLEEHDRQVRAATLERKKEELRAYARGVLDQDFAERQKLLEGSATDVTATVFSMLISISCRVLVERFNWTPIWKHTNGRNRLVRFVNAVQEEAERLINDELLDIRKYAAETYEITGVKFEAGEEVIK